MTKTYSLIFIAILCLISCSISCSNSAKSSAPVGEFKISYFAITQGKHHNQVINSYLGLISLPWAKRHGRRLKEPFEKTVQPSIKAVPNTKANELINILQKSRFYAWPPVDLNRFTSANVNNDEFRNKILTVEINGFSHSVSMNELKVQQDIQSFIKIKQALFRIFNEVDDPSIKIELEDWRDMLTPPMPKKDKE